MINKLDVVQFLITEIKYEEELYKVIEADKEQARKQAKVNKDEDKWGLNDYRYRKYDGRFYSATRIKDNCKKIRQILSDISKEVK